MKVLLALDSSPSTVHLVDQAAARPWPARTTFSVVSVVDIQRFARLPALVELAKREADRTVNAAAETLCRAGHPALPEVLLGFPRRAICDYAKEWHAELVLVGSHGHSAIARFVVGSVAQAILRMAPCSVEIVREGAEGPAGPHPMNILLATDGSDCSVGAVHSVAKRPWPPGTVVKVVSVEERMVFDNQLAASSLSSVYPASLLAELEQAAHDRSGVAVQTAKEILLRAGIQAVNDPRAPVGEPRAVILDESKLWPADMIVLGSHGRRGMDRFFMGSVSESVAIHAHCSVEVIRSA